MSGLARRKLTTTVVPLHSKCQSCIFCIAERLGEPKVDYDSVKSVTLARIGQIV